MGHVLERIDVLVGEVWLCAGQSNMQMGLARAENGEAEVAQANDPLLRLLRVENHVISRGEDAKGEWAECSPASAERFSAAGYYFGRRLRAELDVPVGLICSAWGATSIESWTPIELIRSELAYESTRERDRLRERERPRLEAEYQAAIVQWQAEREAAETSGSALPKPPRQPVALRPQSQSGSLYDSMITPLTPYAIRGVVWYQGESNVGRNKHYQQMLVRLIESWREAWAQERMYFGIVQLPNYRPVAEEPGDSDWAELRESQRLASMMLPDTGLAVTIDLGEADDGHPKNKRGVGDRLARLVMEDVYGSPIKGKGPLLQGVTVKNRYVELRFTEVTGELTTLNDRPLGGFAVLSTDGQWHWAEVKKLSNRILHVWSEAVDKPVAVRYAWSDNPPIANLTDDSRLPAPPFQHRLVSGGAPIEHDQQ